jgi:hypothetical protein
MGKPNPGGNRKSSAGNEFATADQPMAKAAAVD